MLPRSYNYPRGYPSVRNLFSKPIQLFNQVVTYRLGLWQSTRTLIARRERVGRNPLHLTDGFKEGFYQDIGCYISQDNRQAATHPRLIRSCNGLHLICPGGPSSTAHPYRPLSSNKGVGRQWVRTSHRPEVLTPDKPESPRRLRRR
jgi:hypothetical protein